MCDGKQTTDITSSRIGGFAVGAFEYAQDEELSIAHHNHVPAPILNAVRWGLPTVVLIRDPVETIISNRGLQLQIGAVEGRDMSQRVSYDTQLRTWMQFYRRIAPVRDEVVVASFEVVTEDFGTVIDAVNERFGTAFARFEHTEEAIEDLRESYGYHALPTAERDRLKNKARRAFESDVGEEADLVQEARGLFRRYRAAGTISKGVLLDQHRRASQ